MKTKKEVMETLETILKWCAVKRAVLDVDDIEAIKQTMINYSDFYEWLVGKK